MIGRSMIRTFASLALVFVIGSEAASQERVQIVQDAVAVQNSVLQPQLKTYLKSQVGLLKSALTLSDAQQSEIEKLDEAWLKSLAKESKVGREAGNLGAVLFQVLAGQRAAVAMQQPNEEIPGLAAAQKAIDKKLQELLTDEQKQTLSDERKAAEDFQAQALAEYSVALIERHIYLKDDQVQQLQTGLVGKINKNCGWFVYLNNPQYIPTLPAAVLKTVLSKDQMDLLGNYHQHDFVGNDIRLFQMLGNDPFGEQE